VSLLGPIFSLSVRRVDRWLRRSSADPATAQRRVLRTLLRRAKNTRFGREHGFAKLAGPGDFAKAVPITDYDAQRAWIARAAHREAGVAWPGRVPFLARTAGTTGQPKQIPVTHDMIESNRRAGLAVFAHYERLRPGGVRRLLRGKLLFLGGSTGLSKTPGGAVGGDLSAIATRSVCWPLSRRFEPGVEISLIEDWTEKVERIAQRVAGRDIRFAAGLPGWTRILFDRILALRQLPAAGGLTTAWPAFGLFVHSGMDVRPHRNAIRRCFGPEHPLDFLEAYLTTEGFLAVQSTDEVGGLELLLDNGIFYEFLPLDADGPRLTVDEVEAGVPYRLVLSTNAGLWAYELGDVVRFLSTAPPRIAVVGRTAHAIDAAGRTFFDEDVASAVAAAAEKVACVVTAFTTAPTANGRGVQFVVESDDARFDTSAFTAALARDLGKSGKKPSVRAEFVPAGTFHAWMQQRGTLGGQHKVPLCASDRRHVDEVLALAPPAPDVV